MQGIFLGTIFGNQLCNALLGKPLGKLMSCQLYEQGSLFHFPIIHSFIIPPY